MSKYEERLATLTPEARARLEKRLRPRIVSSPEAGIPKRGDAASGAAPLSFAQERLCFLDALAPERAVYNVFVALELEGALDVEALQTSLDDLATRHETLRTTFDLSGTPGRQVVHPAEGFALERVSLDRSGAGENENGSQLSALREMLAREAHRPFDLANGPLARGLLIRLADERHVLELVLHHAVADAWSLAVLLSDLWAFYEARCTGLAPALSELPVQYGDFAAWQRERLSGARLEKELDYWRDPLADAPSGVTLPPDHDRPRTPSLRGAHETFQLSRELLDRLKHLARSEEVSLNMILLGGLAALLTRMTGEEDMVLGSAVAGRHRPEVERLVGPLASTLPLRLDTSGDPSVRELLKRVRTASLDAQAHQDVPFEKLVSELAPERDPGQNPFFQIVVSLQIAPDAPTKATRGNGDEGRPSLVARRVDVESRRAHLDLAMTFVESPRGLTGALEYATDLYERETIRRALARFERILSAAAADVTLPLSELPLVDATEARLLDGFTGRHAPLPDEATVARLFEDALRRAPERPAIVSDEGELTYRDLEARANGIAHALVRRGVVRGDVVAVALPRSRDLLIALLGILKSGAAYLALDKDYPTERIRFLLEDAKVRLVVTTGEQVAGVDLAGRDPVMVEEVTPASEAPVSGGRIVADDLAYVCYTSGSTGEPKGVAVTHRGVVRLVKDVPYASLDETRRVLHMAPPTFDASTFEIWGALLKGGAVVVHRGGVPSATELETELRRHEVTTVWLTSGLFNALVDERPGCLASTVEVLVGGEALSPAHVRKAQDACPRTQFVNGYGPTEGTTFTACYRIPRERREATTSLSLPIGEPLPGTRVFVLDRYGHRVPVGVQGELYIGGEGLARGYLDRPDQTAERFVPDSVSGLPGARLYRTGDAVRLLPNGTLDYVGRLDDQVKLRGYRVEPGEVESVLTAHPEVRAAAVVVSASGSSAGSRQLVAYFVPSRPGELVATELRDYASRRLPEYMVPQVWVELEALPLTRNGKLDRKALPAPSVSRSLDSASVAPRDPLEEALAEIWKDVLGLEHLGVHDDFFELGGHSLIAMRMMTRAREVLRVELPLRKIFESPTVASLAAEIEAQRRAGVSTKIPPLSPASDGKALRPLSFAQERLWILDQIAGASPAYHIPSALRLEGPLDLEALRSAVDAIVERHEVLRTRFVADGDSVSQAVVPVSAASGLPLVDLSGLGEVDRAQETRQVLRARARRTFDLARGPLVRFVLVRESGHAHVMQVTMHHIASDAWSLGVFWRELGLLYTSARNGESSPLPPLPVQYADYAVWQRGWLSDETLEDHLAYWREVLPSGLPGTELPHDRPRPLVPGFKGDRRVLSLSAESSQAIRKACRDEGVTLFMMLLAGFQILLQRRVGQDAVVVGTPTANRGVSAAEGLIGFFANSLALRTDLSGAPSFRDALSRVREVALGAYVHQDVPFEKVVEAVSPERDAKRNPLFQISFALQSVAVGAPELPDLRLTGVSSSAGATRFDLEVHVFDRPEGLRVVAAYDAELYEPETIDRLLRQYGTLMTAAIAEPLNEIAALPMLDAEERHHLLKGLNATERKLPAEARIEAVFAARLAENPDAVALVSGDESWSYRELDERSDRVASRLRLLGVSAESPVGVLGDRSLELYAVLLGILKSGGAYVPLDAAYPAERIAFMVEDAGLEALLVDRASEALVSSPRLPVLRWDEAMGETAEVSESSDPGENLGELAYLIYTSGSTGVPKAVAVSHHAVLRLLFGVDYVELGPEERLLQLAPVAFDASTFEIWGALLKGGALVLHPERVPTADRLRETLVEQRVSTLWLTASLFNALVDEDPSLFASVKQLLVGGEALSAAHIRRAQHHCPGTTFVNGYGPTEGTTFTCCYRIPSPLHEAQTSVPIGGPIANTRLYVLDSELELCPYGAPGELYIGGSGLARGYWDRPELTAERFVPHPFGAPGERLYRTGDVTRWLASGELEYLGRLDSQVKLRGFRVELGEVEAALRADERVRDAAAVVRTDRSGDKRLVAYVVLVEGASAVVSDLRGALARRLPDYMIPQSFVTLPALPLSANGKVDRDRLPESDLEADSDLASPRGPLEEGIAEVFQEVLGVESLGVRDNFFELGGHSLLAMRLVSRVKRAFRVELTFRDFFEEPTVSGLASRVEAHYQAGQVVPAPALPRLGPDSERPLSFAQQRLWFLAELDPESSAYNIPSTFRLEGPLDVSALTKSVQDLVARHEALRTVFRSREGRAEQRVLDLETLPYALPVVDLTSLRPEAREAEARRLAITEARTVFDLSRGPLLRARLVRLDARDHQIMLSTHHAASDGWSQGILYRELGTLYGAHLEGRTAELHDLPVQYADYAAWQRQWLDGAVLERQMDYWRQKLEGAAVLELPTDFPRPAIQSFEGRWESIPLSGALRGALRRLARTEGVTYFMTLLAAFQTLLHRYTGQEDIVVGTPVANRTRPEIEPLIGFFANNLVMRGDFGGEPSFRDVLARARDTALGAYAHQELPFEKLVDELAPERSLSRSPLFQVAFALHSVTGGGLSLRDVTAVPQESRIRTTRFDLELYLWDRPDGLTAVCFYNTSLFATATIRRLLEHFRNLLAAVVREPDTRVASLPILSSEERAALLGFGTRPRGEPIAASHHSLSAAFDAAAARFPERVAVTMPPTPEVPRVDLTYAELHGRATRLARSLSRLGVGPEVLVGISLERSPALLVAILGVLKAGGAYVPLDPAYPGERLRTMVEDSGSTLVVTEPRHRERFSREEIEIALLDASGCEVDEAASAGRSDAPSESEAEGDNLAYVIYTSGSSGRPKGVGVTHGNALRLFSATAPWYRFDENDVFTLFHSYAFDFSVWEIFGALLHGGRLVVVPHWVSRDPEAFYDLLRHERVSVLSQTPSAFRQLVRVDEGREAHETISPALRAVVFGGEALELAPLLPWVRRHRDRPTLVNMYGITETTVHVTYRVITPEDVEARRGSIIGGPIPDLRTYVLDEDLEPAPLGVRGEIGVAGLGLARGYLGRPALTAERFVPDPHASEPGARLYRSGDLGRYLADGDIEYLGRADQQIKLRGFRIELGEIEAALSSHPSVGDAVVRLKQGPSGSRLVAWVVPRLPESLEVSELRAHLSRKLPEYMVPAAIMPIAALPLTAQGKLDVSCLPEAEASSPREGALELPANVVETALSEIWKQVLGVASVVVDDNFFELGGDSILSIQVVARAAERGIALTVRDLFQHQTLRALAAVARETEGEVRPMEQEPVEGPTPLTPIQRWFFEQGLEAPHHVNQSMLLEIPIGFRGDLLPDVLAALVSRHDALRLRFRPERSSPEGWVQEHADSRQGELCLYRVDLSAVTDEAERRAAIEREARGAQESLDLTEGPLARVVWLDLGAGSKGRILWVIHHLVVDGVSWRILLADFERAYRQRERGEAIVLGRKTSSYRSWAERLEAHGESEALLKELDYWRPVAEASRPLPTDHAPAEGANREAHVAHVVRHLSREETSSLLREAPSRLRAEVSELLLGALAVAVSRVLGEDEVVVTLEGHGREELFEGIDVTETVGWFTSLFPVRLCRAPGESAVEVLDEVKRALRSVPNKGIGYGILRYASRRGRDVLSLSASPSMSFNYLGQFDAAMGRERFFEVARETVSAVRSPRNERAHVIDVTAVVSSGRLSIDWMFSLKLHDRSTLRELASVFLETVRELLVASAGADAGPEYQSSDFALAELDQEKLQKLLTKKLGNRH